MKHLPALALSLLLALPAAAQNALPTLPGQPPAQQSPPQGAQPQPLPPPKPQAAPQTPSAPPIAPTDAIARIDAARGLYRSNRLLQAADELDAAIDAIYRQLGQAYAPTLPLAPQGWSVEKPDPNRLALLGGSVTAARDYRQNNGEGRMNARIVLDSEAVRQMQPLFANPPPVGLPQTVRRVRVGDGEAVVAYDPKQRGGEVSMLVGNRILIQIEGQNVPSADPMLAVIREWNIAQLRKIAGL